VGWREDLESTWRELGALPPGEFLGRIVRIVDDPGVPAAVRDFQVACAHDSTGRSDLAVAGYRRALAAGLDGYEARRARIQLASSLRNLGEPQEGVRLLRDEPTSIGDGLDDAVVVFLALALADVGREREAVARLVHALAEHLPRYRDSAPRYADALAPRSVEPSPPGAG
jgi:hypothetical protein